MKKIASIIPLIIIVALASFVIHKDERPLPAKDSCPNIIIILADDLGFSDIGCYGGEINTPNLDYLAANGVRFSNFYNTSRCCPSRASLLTGMYNHNAGIGEMTEDRHLPGYRGHITDSVATIAELLKQAGYHTAMSGKWHVSNTVEQSTKEDQLKWLNHQLDAPLFSPIEQYPVNRGFEKYFGNIWGVVDYFDPFSLVSGSTPIKEVPKDYYHTDAINDTAVAYIKELSSSNKPFFLYVAQTAPHWPLMAPEEDIQKYISTYTSGWEAVREARYNKMVKIGLVDPGKAPLSARWEDSLHWKDNPHKDWDARAMAVHAAMVDRIDQGIGRIITALKQTNQLNNTVIIFLSDNGASAEVAANYGPGFDRPSETRDGKTIHYVTNKDIMPGPETTYTSIGPRWANVANTPYRYWKAESYEGGIHTPFIAFWPNGLKLKKGSINKEVCHVMDIMPTCLELAKATYPETYNGHAILPVQGISFLPVLKDEKYTGHDVLCNEHFGAKYIRKGEWKLVAKNNEAWHLYHIADDETEMNDLAAKYPEKVRQMDSVWKIWANANLVFPKK
ncbi:arylsulfatase [Parafilimonas terrae]|uniref:Arylsulfatase n=1 Tax=Parafilimonas terrae TaxID=1465490 RepID=A0A1I5WUZ2_9BACT|nr:arylsulfatase [Parafilimonas terrae]SFQ23592.1 arylsulfatase [Parafilimonas terrae]